ncbi:hypothetical protein RRG08_058532 [Elysia crispata]|nr:hypothetical protein RRG08_058532 [Elysia crispata]
MIRESLKAYQRCPHQMQFFLLVLLRLRIISRDNFATSGTETVSSLDFMSRGNASLTLSPPCTVTIARDCGQAVAFSQALLCSNLKSSPYVTQRLPTSSAHQAPRRERSLTPRSHLMLALPQQEDPGNVNSFVIKSPYSMLCQYHHNAAHNRGFAFNSRQLISVCVNITSFGSCVAYLLLVAQNLMTLFPAGITSYGNWLIITAAVLSPFCWLGTPKDFWPVALCAVLTTAVASILILTQIVRDASNVPTPFFAPLDFKSFLMAFGLLSFGFGGHQVFPTIQVDMKRPENFVYSAAFGLSIVLCMYLPVAVTAFTVYGSNIHDNVLMSLLPGCLHSIAMVLMTVHLLGGFIIILNPVNQEMEGIFNIPNCFCFRRVMLRTGIVGLLLFVALSVPQFGAIMALIGGSTMAFLVFIIPSVCYLKLSSMKGNWKTV